MSLRDLLQSELNGLGGGADVVSVSCDEKQLTCEVVSADVLACQFNRLSVRTAALADASIEQLKDISNELSRRITYLLEAIGPIEQDHEQCIVQMRSNPPQTGDDGTCYYELLVRRGGELVLCRYQKSPGSVRQVVPAVVTREVLLRLADDFEAVLP